MKKISAVVMTSVLLSACASTYSTLEPSQEALITPPTQGVEQPADADAAVRRGLLINVNAACAYEVLADIENWTSWDPALKEARYVSGQSPQKGTVFFQDFGDFQARSTVIEADPGRRLRWRGQDPEGGGPVGIHTWTLIPQTDGQTLVLNDEHFHCWYMRPVTWFTDLGIGEQFDLTLRAFAAEASRRCPAA